MPQLTKYALEKSLKKLMLQKPLDKITINDITEYCGISRSTFYYNFKDIHSLVAWTCLQDARQAPEGKKTYKTWQQGLIQILHTILDNKLFIMNVYHSVSREQVEKYLYPLIDNLLMGVVGELSDGMVVQEKDKAFIAQIYSYTFVGLMLDWIKEDMNQEPETLVSRFALVIQDDITQALNRFRADKTASNLVN